MRYAHAFSPARKGTWAAEKNTNKKPESKGGAYFSLCLSWFLFPASRCLWGIWKLECQRTPTSVFRPRELCRNFLRKLDAPIQELVKCTIEIQHYACHQNICLPKCVQQSWGWWNFEASTCNQVHWKTQCFRESGQLGAATTRLRYH